MTTFRDLIITSTGDSVRAWKRGKELIRYEGHTGSVHTLLTFGDQLITVSSDNVLTAFDIATGGEIAQTYPRNIPFQFVWTRGGGGG